MNNSKLIKKEIEFAGKKLSLEYGKLAMSADMSLTATYGDTVLLVTAVSGGLNSDLDFFPLMINYVENLYASGTVKSSRFVKRDGNSTDDARITQRLCDHAVRPLFPNDFSDEVQVVASVLSLDEDADPTFLFMNAVSAALHASNIPWEGPAVSARIGYVNGDYVLNPTREVLHTESDLDMTVSFVGEDKRFLAVEAEANILSEEKILGAIEFARNNLDPVLKLIKEFAEEINPGNKKYEYVSQKLPEDLVNDVDAIAKERVIALMKDGMEKPEMKDAMDAILEEVYTKLEGKYKKATMYTAFSDIEKHALRHMVLTDGKRPDGRGLDEVRNIWSEINVLPRTHGSAIFTRGITQVMTVVTLGSPSEELIIQDMFGEDKKKYMHFYTSPPFASNEVGRVGGYPKNREIGHGMLAEKALRPVLPTQLDFPYTMVLNSQVMSSSGSTSMASTCGSSLALLAAGVPISAMVGGISIGLIKNDDFSDYRILTDIAYMEDAFGFLDFKMTGTKEGVTAIQCDMKVAGIPIDLIPKIIEQSKEGRMHVLGKMEEVITEPSKELSKYAPKVLSTVVKEDQIGTVIGSGGKTIKLIQEKTGAEVNIQEDGTVSASSQDIEKAQAAIEYVVNMFRDIKIGEIFEGKVEEIVDFGAFVEILPGRTGLLHVSEIANDYVEKVTDYINAGDTVQVKVIDVDKRAGKIALSKKALEPGAEERPEGDQDRGGRGGRDGDRRGGFSSDRRGGGRPSRDRGGRSNKRY